MSTYISYRLFHITVILMAFFIAFTAISFAQETDSADNQTPRQIRPLQLNETAVERVAEKRAEVKERNEARKAEFMEKVEEITDEAKRNALERIMTAIETINDNKTTRWAQALDKFSDVLERIKTKLDALEEDGVNTATAVTKVTEAESAIADATTAVEAQADKVYEAEITDETTLREVIQPLVQGFKQDIRTTLSTVVAARDAVKEAARALAAVNSDSQSGSESTTNTQNTLEP